MDFVPLSKYILTHFGIPSASLVTKMCIASSKSRILISAIFFTPIVLCLRPHLLQNTRRQNPRAHFCTCLKTWNLQQRLALRKLKSLASAGQTVFLALFFSHAGQKPRFLASRISGLNLISARAMPRQAAPATTKPTATGRNMNVELVACLRKI